MLAAALQSLLVGILATLIALLLGVPAAWKLSARSGGLWRAALIVLPLALPAPVAVSGWVQWIAPDAASSFAIPIPGLDSFLRSLLFSPIGAAAVLGFSLWPVVTLHAWPSFNRARDEVHDAALLNAAPRKVFFQVILPRSSSEIAVGAALVFLLATSDFTVTSLLLVRTLAVSANDAVALGKISDALWISMPLGLLAAVLGLLIARWTHSPARVAHQTSERPKKHRVSILTSVFSASGIFLGFFIPLLFCLRGVLISGKAPSAAFRAGADSLGLSLRLAAAAALLTCAFAVLRILLWSERRTNALNVAAVFLLAVPGAALGSVLLATMLKISGGFTTPNFAPAWLAIGFAVRFIYIPLRLVEAGLASIDQNLFDSAAALGQSRYSRAISIALPLLSGHLAAAAALVFVFVLGEVSVAAVLAPPGVTPASIWLFNQQHMGYDESVFALSLLLGGAAAAIVFAGALISQWIATSR